MRNGWIAAGALMGVALAGTARAQERFTLEGSQVAVYNLAGAMRVEAGTGPDVVVEITRRGSDAARLSIRRGEANGFRHLAVVYPGDEVVYEPMGRGSSTNLDVASDGTFGNSHGFFGRNRVTVHGSGGGAHAWADIRVLVPAGRTVAVNNAVGRIDVANVRGDLRVKGHASPIAATGTRGPLNLDTGSGSIQVTDAEGDVRLDTGSGGVQATNVRGGGLSIDTGSGGVQASGLSVARLHVDVGSGGVRLDGVASPSVDIDTGSGSVDLRMRSDADYVKIDTGSGGVMLALPAAFGADADIDTGSGGIRVNVPATVRRSTRDHFTGAIGDGRGRLIIDTGSGGVQLVRI